MPASSGNQRAADSLSGNDTIRRDGEMIEISYFIDGFKIGLVVSTIVAIGVLVLLKVMGQEIIPRDTPGGDLGEEVPTPTIIFGIVMFAFAIYGICAYLFGWWG
jgi:hypothetical protein